VRANQLSNGHEQVDVRATLRASVCGAMSNSGAWRSAGMSLDGLMLDESYRRWLGDQRIAAELAALDDGGRRGSRDDRVGVGQANGLVDAALDERKPAGTTMMVSHTE